MTMADVSGAEMTTRNIAPTGWRFYKKQKTLGG
jgi:hypothetical protein